MIRFTFVGLLACLISVSAFAARVSFTDSVTAAKADLSTRVISRGNSNGIDVKFRLPAIDVTSVTDGFNEVKVKGLSPLGAIGKPATLVTGSLFVIPEGHEYEAQVVSQREQEVPGVVLQPAQRKFRCNCKDDFSFDSGLYKSNEVFPALPIKVEEVGKMQGLRLARLSIQPLRVDFSKRSLRVTTEMDVRILFKKVASNAKPVLVPKSVYDFARRLTANGSALNRDAVRVVGPETLLIFTADSLQSSIAPLVQWKRAKGLNVEVRTLTEVGGTKEKLKEYIQNYYNTHAVKPSYLLFVGDGTLLPPFMEEVTTSFNGPAASDHSFALLSGEDAIPDAFYGRLVAANEAEAKTQVERWIAYERNPERASDWYTKAATIASDEGDSPSDKEYAEQVQAALKAFTYKSFDTFLQGEQTATAEKISAAVNDGRSWLTYFGHGSGTGWGSTNDTFELEQVEKLTNNRLLFMVDVACDNGSYVAIPDNFGKKWMTLKAQDKAVGAVAYYGGTVSISWDPPAIMAVGIAKTHFEKPVYTVGQTVLAGQLYLIEQKGTNEDTLDNLKWYTLFGDPSMLLRTDTAKAVQVKHQYKPGSIGFSVAVQATDTAGKALPGLLVSLNKDAGDTQVALGMTDANGQVELTVTGQGASKAMQLTVTGYNVETYESTLLSE